MELMRTTLFLPKKEHRLLKELSLKKQTSMAKLVQKALKIVYFRDQERGAKSLWGVAQNTNISEKELTELKSKLNPKT